MKHVILFKINCNSCRTNEQELEFCGALRGGGGAKKISQSCGAR